MKKFLIVAHYSRFLILFELGNVRLLQNMGFEVHYATNYQGEDMVENAAQAIREKGVILHQIDFIRSPYNIPANLKAYRQLKRLMREIPFLGLHCHTPMAGALARLAAHATNTAPVLYTAHGFHFYKGCSFRNRLLYETAERFLARYTDALLTINQEDYTAAQTFPLRGRAYYIPGVGINVESLRTSAVDRAEKRRELGIPENVFLFVAVGELIPRKNHRTAIEAFAKANTGSAVFVLCGTGALTRELEALIATLHLQNRVVLLGFRSDIREILHCADAFVFPSLQEGLPVALMEAMAAGLPCIASRIRGNVDLLPESTLLFDPRNTNELAGFMQLTAEGKDIEKEVRQNRAHLLDFDASVVEARMQRVYETVLRNDTINDKKPLPG